MGCSDSFLKGGLGSRGPGPSSQQTPMPGSNWAQSGHWGQVGTYPSFPEKVGARAGSWGAQKQHEWLEIRQATSLLSREYQAPG
jgi:hypothetical protein